MFEFLFKYPRQYFQTGELIPQTWGQMSVMLGLFVLGVALILFTAWRNRTDLHPAKTAVIASLQLAVLALVLVMLARPVLEIEQLRPQDNQIIVLVDTSRSMALSDDGQLSRLEAVLPTLTDDILEPLQERGYKVQLQSFEGGLESAEQLLEVRADNRSAITDRLITALRSASSQALAGLILVSDGADNSGGVNELWFSQLQSYGVPIQTLGVGSEIMLDDSEISAVDLPDASIPNAVLRAEVTLQSGTARQTTLKVYDHDRIVASQPVNLPGQGNKIRLSVSIPTGDVGLRQLRFSLDPSATESNLVNNEYRHNLTVAQTQPKVLYVEGEPRWEYKFIRRAIEAAGFVHLHGLVQTSTNKSYRQGIDSPEQLENGFPSSREELFQYQALIIGSERAAMLSQEQIALIKDFVDVRGGSLLMLGGLSGLSDGGWQNTLLAGILPVQLPTDGTTTFVRTQAKVVTTAAGLRSAWLRFSDNDQENLEHWNLLPDIADYQVVGDARLGATVLLQVEHNQTASPLLAYQRYGRGKTYVLASGGTWRWQMQMPSEDQSHEIFWQALLQNMISEVPNAIDFHMDQNWFRDNNRVEVSATIRDPGFEPSTDANVKVKVTDSSGQTQNIDLTPVPTRAGTYRGTALVETQGLAQLDISASLGETQLDPVRLFAEVSEGSLEYFNAAQNTTFLKRIAADTGGQYFTSATAASILDELRFSKSGITETQWLALWNMPINFLLLLTLKMSEWMLRRRWGRL